MKIDCERQVIQELGCHFFADSEPGSVRERIRVERLVAEQPHECDGCGLIAPDVDLWAENSETGEEIWLCVACGSW
jgi:hypothetical protein